MRELQTWGGVALRIMVNKGYDAKIVALHMEEMLTGADLRGRISNLARLKRK